jgi:FkbM family methyltransferase
MNWLSPESGVSIPDRCGWRGGVSTFLDVGAHEGQTLVEVTKARWGFDRVVAFEPMPVQFGMLAERFGGLAGVELCNFGLAGASGAMSMFGTNSNMGASIFSAKNDVDASVVTECRFVDASAWFEAFLPPDEKVVVKLNCEGSEVPILSSLLDSGQIWRVADVMIDWDIRKVPGMEYREGEILARFRDVGFTGFSLCDDVMWGATHQDRIANWLGGSRAVRGAV